ncbi:MAG: tRNA (adenosine(37)-N6)-threonylcarbamoyltransferase complex transferase subunit TsaD [Chlamydiota bacterium]
MTLVLGIESTCDETGCAIVKDGHQILSNIVSSQIDLHSEFGGVVPELACRQHIEVLIPVIRQALDQAEVSLKDIDLISAARGPGLIGALLIGLNAAKALSYASEKPFIGVNHIEAHLYAAMMGVLDDLRFPALGVVVSGGHTFLVKINDIGSYQALGTTIDDAVGEAFDKVAKIMDIPYPGGPNIEKLAKDGDSHYYDFKPGKIKGRPLDFSFSGLKTSVLYTVKGQSAKMKSPLIISEEEKKHVAASFQRAALSDITKKIEKALKDEKFECLILGGGVTNNNRLREMVAELELDIPVYWPPRALTQDNAAMIAGLGYQQYQRQGHPDPWDLEPQTAMPLL